MDCLRRYFYQYVLGWSEEMPNVHLEFGNAWHKAMEVVLAHKKPGSPYPVDCLMPAVSAFSQYYRQFFNEDDDERFVPKTPENAAAGLAEYIVTYASSDLEWEPLWTEIAGSVDVGMDRPIHFRCDAIIDCHDGSIVSLEHKTGPRNSRVWIDQWNQKVQIGTYLHLLHCLFPDQQPRIIVNGFFPHQIRLKQSGGPYANSKGPEFFRVPVSKTPEMMNDWLHTVIWWLELIDHQFQELDGATEDDPVLVAFPKNTESCTKYFGCPFGDICMSHANPLQHLDTMPAGFAIKHWDPRQFRETAGKVVEV